MRRAHSQVFHGTNFEVPYLNARPSVLTLHDLSPWRDAAWHTGAERVRRRAPWLLRLGIATMVITPSEAIRREAIRSFGLAPERVAATPLGPPRTSPPPAAAPPGRAFFLFVGTLEPRKNIPLLIEAWRAVRFHCDVDLVLAGRLRADAPAIASEPGLDFRGEVTDGELLDLYRDATAFIYPSHYEGFGLPVLEAMHCGAPVITSSDPALVEVSGDAGIRADTVQELAAAMRALFESPAFRADRRNESRRRAAGFSWAAAARQTRAVYLEAIARFG